MTLTKGNGGREGGKGQRWDVLLKGGLGVLPQKKNWNLDPLRLILMQFEGQNIFLLLTINRPTYARYKNCNLNGLCHCLFHFTVLYNRECENAKGGKEIPRGGRMPPLAPP